MGAYLAILATLFSQLRAGQDAKDAEAGRHEEAKRQFLRDVRRQYAQQLDPSTPIFGAEASDFAHQEALAKRYANAQQDANKRQMFASILPAAVSAFGNAYSAPSGNDVANDAIAKTNPTILDRFNQPSSSYSQDDWDTFRNSLR